MAVRSWLLEEIRFPENLDTYLDLDDELERDLDENLPPLPPPLPPRASINAINKTMTAKYIRVFVFIASCLIPYNSYYIGLNAIHPIAM